MVVSRLPTPDSRLPTPDSRLPTPYRHPLMRQRQSLFLHQLNKRFNADFLNQKFDPCLVPAVAFTIPVEYAKYRFEIGDQ